MLNKFIQEIKKTDSQMDINEIEKAFRFAQIVHVDQKRKSGESVMSHLVATASVLVGWKLDTASIVAGLLHDTIEDSQVTHEEIEKKFGSDVALIVDGVTKIGDIKLRGRTEEAFVENLRKMILVMAKDLRVVLIKLADRYHNLQTLSYLEPDKQKQIANETLEVYAPLAERLGIGEMKGRLEDLSFFYCYPEEYKEIKKFSAPYYHLAQEYIEMTSKIIQQELENERLKAQINGRAKHLYSLWRKLQRPEIDKDINKIYDLVALRILTSSVRDCYAALGIVHKIFKPLPSVGIRDFIAYPKPNGYRSIHTTVFGPKGKIIEVQIRTYEMHEEAENGIAAHWFYADTKKRASDQKLESGFFAPDEKLSWVKQLVSWQKEIVDSHEFLEALKFDALGHRIFVFSPKGDVFDLPRDATPLDFAYRVHTSLGNKAIGAKVDGKMVSLNSKIKSGQMVEILVDKNKKSPSRDWLKFVVTQTARREIKRNFKSS